MLTNDTGVDPRVGAWFCFLFVLLTGVGAGSVMFPGVPDAIVAAIKQYAIDGAFAISCANLVFHLYSAPTAGPMVTKD